MTKPWDGIISEDEQRAYRAAGFGRPTGLGTNPALLIIDVQYRTTGTVSRPFWESIKEFPTSCGDVAWRAVDKIQTLLGLFRERNWPVLYPYVSPKTTFDSGPVVRQGAGDHEHRGEGLRVREGSRAAPERCSAAEEAPERLLWNAAGELPDQSASRHRDRHGLHHERLCPRIGRRRIRLQLPCGCPERCCLRPQRGIARGELVRHVGKVRGRDDHGRLHAEAAVL